MDGEPPAAAGKSALVPGGSGAEGYTCAQDGVNAPGSAPFLLDNSDNSEHILYRFGEY